MFRVYTNKQTKTTPTMKNKAQIAWTVAAILATTAHAKKITVNVNIPGTLSEQITANKFSTINDLKIKGTLNGTDWRLLRKLLDADGITTAQKGNTVLRLDLSETKLKKDNTAYSADGKTINDENAIPQEAFAGCAVDEIIMPISLTHIEAKAFCNSKVKRVVLAENTSIDKQAFDNCRQLEEVVFPRHAENIKHCFTNCPKLKTLKMHNVRYIAGSGTVKGCPNLREIVIDGTIGHIDGWDTFTECASLERVVFGGNIISSGGGTHWLSNCPQLKEIVFEKGVLSTAFAETPGCPLFKDYTVNGVIFNSANTQVLPQTDITDTSQRAKSKRLFREMADYLKSRNYSDANAYTLLLMGSLAHQLDITDCDYDKYKSIIFSDLQKSIDNGEGSIDLESSIFDWLKNDTSFVRLAKEAKEYGGYIGLLRKYSRYSHDSQTPSRFTYELNTPLLKQIRDSLKLDSIAGNGDEISKIKNVMYWLHNAIRHDGSSSWPSCKYNALELYRLAKKEKRPYNCRFLGMMLADCYLALGMPARFIICSSKKVDDPDCHVMAIVWSRTLNKWVWMDPSFAAYITDENGTLLNHREVRERLIKGLPLNLNEDANWNNETKQTKEEYLESYMAKNLFYLSCHADNRPEVESDGKQSDYIILQPLGSECHGGGIKTTDADFFWQAPDIAR